MSMGRWLGFGERLADADSDEPMAHAVITVLVNDVFGYVHLAACLKNVSHNELVAVLTIASAVRSSKPDMGAARCEAAIHCQIQ